MSSKIMFTSKTREFARARQWDARALAYHAGISLNTAKAWIENEGVSYINGTILGKLVAAFDLDHWTDLIETDNGAGHGAGQ